MSTQSIRGSSNGLARARGRTRSEKLGRQVRTSCMTSDWVTFPGASDANTTTLFAVILILLLTSAAKAQNSAELCTEDAMVVFDASGSMFDKVGGDDSVSRIDEARLALAKILPSATRFRRVGLITFGPGAYDQCNVTLDLQPVSNAASSILRVVNALVPAGRTPLTAAVEDAANVLDYRNKPAVVVVVTDGEETCDRSPCEVAAKLHETAKDLTVHVIGYRMENGWTGTGSESRLESKCLAERNNGLFVTADSEEELVASLQKALGCPLISEQAH
jgi:Ca-activated chloride channel family protein